MKQYLHASYLLNSQSRTAKSEQQQTIDFCKLPYQRTCLLLASVLNIIIKKIKNYQTCFVGHDAPKNLVETSVRVPTHSVKSKNTSFGRSLQGHNQTLYPGCAKFNIHKGKNQENASQRLTVYKIALEFLQGLFMVPSAHACLAACATIFAYKILDFPLPFLPSW